MNDERITFLQGLAQALLDKATIYVCLLFLLAVLRNTASRAIEGLFWKMGRTYNVDDAVVVNGRRGRITSQNIWVTVFYFYTWQKGKKEPTGGTIMVVSNTELGKMRIEKPLVLHSGRWDPNAPEVHEGPV